MEREKNMEKLFEKLMNMGMEQFAEDTRQGLVLSDEDYLKDIEDEKRMEQRYEEMNIPQDQRMFLNDYISCMRTADSRYSDISYAAGIKDAIRMFKYLDLLKEVQIAG